MYCKNVIKIFIVSLFSLFLLSVGCRTTLKYTDLSNQLPYKNLVGKHYIILQDFYLVKLTGLSEATLSPCGTNGLPEKFDKNNIGKTIKGGQIVGAVSKNSEFTLMKIIRYDLVDNIHIVILIPEISFSSQFNNVEASALVNEDGKANIFEFNKNLVKEI